jgi:hypothetical protein
MPRTVVYFIVTILIVAAGALFYLPRLMDDTDFRIADFAFGSSASGVGATEPTVTVGKKVWLLLKLRGCTPDNSRRCKGTLSIKLQSATGTTLKDFGVRPYDFPKKTRITHLDLNESFVVPPAPAGPYVVKVEATDDVAKKTATADFKFRVAP